MSSNKKPIKTRLTRSMQAVVMLGVVGLTLSMPMPAHAGWMSGVYEQILSSLQQQLMSALTSQFGLNVGTAVAEAGAAQRAEILKGAMADKAVTEGIAAYEQQEILRREQVKTYADLQQPVTTCQTIAAAPGIGSANTHTKQSTQARQQNVLRKLGTNTSTGAVLEQSHETTNASFCTRQEAQLGICVMSSNDLAGADQSAARLYQSGSGASTYKGGPSGPEAAAANRYIERVVATIPPEQLRHADYARSPQSRAYIELQRRYSAMLSMSSYSLGQIAQARTPQAGLGTATKMADVTIGGFESGKVDMSMLEAVERLVATKFSPDSIIGNAAATSPDTLLRDIAQTTSFRLWVDHQTLLQDERFEALLAHQLALLTEQTLRPQLDSQRAAAVQAAAGRP